METGELEEKYGMFVESLYHRFDWRRTHFNFSEKEQEAQDKVLKDNKSEPADPFLTFTDKKKDLMSRRQMKPQTVEMDFLSGIYWNDKMEMSRRMGVAKATALAPKIL